MSSYGSPQFKCMFFRMFICIYFFEVLAGVYVPGGISIKKDGMLVEIFEARSCFIGVA